MTAAKTCGRTQQFFLPKGEAKKRRDQACSYSLVRSPGLLTSRSQGCGGHRAVFMLLPRARWSISASTWAPPRPGALIHNT